MNLENEIKTLLEANLGPQFIELIDDSQRHAGHKEAQQSGGGHFILHIVSDQFSGLTTLDRQRLIYKILDGHFKQNKIHALSLKCLTSQEYRSLGPSIKPSNP